MNIEIKVPDGESGDWAISSFEITDQEAKIFNIRAMLKPGCRVVHPGKYKQLTRNGAIIMSNTPAEISDLVTFIYKAKRGGDILINGLGLGVALSAVLESPDIKTVTVVEKSPDVINLVASSFAHDHRVTIINADAFDWQSPKAAFYAAAWHDIWDDICGDNLPEMAKLHRKYARKAEWQGSWCKDLCKRLK